MTCPGVLVCVGREPFSPLLLDFIRKSSEERLPGLGSRSPGLGPRTPGNGARSPATQVVRSPPHGAHSRGSEYSEGYDSKKNGKLFWTQEFALILSLCSQLHYSKRNSFSLKFSTDTLCLSVFPFSELWSAN